MNHRIKELAKQAGFYVSANDAEILIPDPHTEDITEVTEKFAELIVRECVLHLHRRGVEGFDILEERNLKEHFGIEE